MIDLCRKKNINSNKNQLYFFMVWRISVWKEFLWPMSNSLVQDAHSTHWQWINLKSLPQIALVASFFSYNFGLFISYLHKLRNILYPQPFLSVHIACALFNGFCLKQWIRLLERKSNETLNNRTKERWLKKERNYKHARWIATEVVPSV